jgi:hypothetical protein
VRRSRASDERASAFKVGHQAFIVDRRTEPLPVTWRALCTQVRRRGRGEFDDLVSGVNSDAADNLI